MCPYFKNLSKNKRLNSIKRFLCNELPGSKPWLEYNDNEEIIIEFKNLEHEVESTLIQKHDKFVQLK